MPQVVDASNLEQLTRTGTVPDFKPPGGTPAIAPETKGAPASEPRAPEKEPAPHHSATQPRENGKFTSASEGDRTTPAPKKAPSAPSAQGSGEDDDEGGDNLPEPLREVVRKAIGKKHRQMKEAEEFARSEFRGRTAAEEKAASLQRQLDELTQKSRPSPAEAPTEPKQSDFATIGEYTDALVNYRVEQRFIADRAKAEKEAEERAKAERVQEYGRRLADAKNKHDDFDDVLRSLEGTALDRVHSDVIEYITEAEQGPELLYHLAKNPDVLGRLQKLSPRRFIAELGKLEATFDADVKSTKNPESAAPATLTEAAAPAHRPVSRAPEPIAPLDTSGVASVTKKPEEMSVSELRDYRRQEAAQRRAKATR